MLTVRKARKKTTRVMGALLTALFLSLPTPAAAQSPHKYAALGDSYSSGQGAPPYEEDAACKRSRKAYPWQYANAVRPGRYSLVFAACSGAVIGDVANENGLQRRALRGNPSSTRVVTITVGGNDIGFSDVMWSCIKAPDCQRRDAEVEQRIRDTKGPLGRLYDALKSDLEGQGRNALMYVLTYPQFFADPDEPGAQCKDGISREEQIWIRAKFESFNNAIEEVARAHGLRVIDIEGAFKRHEVCKAVTYANGFDNDGAFHPNDLGHRHLAGILDRRIAADGG